MAAPKPWRYLPFLTAPGAVQMALDLWLLAQHGRGGSRPALRFYAWEPAALSLGYHQRRYPETWRQLSWRGQPVDLVRRPSGGRAVLHDGDLTYAIATAPLPGSRQQTYEYLCQMLIAGWRSLGVTLHYGRAGRAYAQEANCFALATGADLVTADGIKAIGSAQLRHRQSILQHGSMRLGTGSGLYAQVFDRPEPPRLAVEPERAIAALKLACQRCFAAELVEQPLDAQEWQAVQAIAVQIRAGQQPAPAAIAATAADGSADRLP